ncbi:hypothetical protein GPJ56_003522 [Histomonas meleagridis]|uniref:uncharacterized protein n=1 Tax=Histomonas meleagridis TaxID=135588 RepID=UPI0035595F22|nr:hypothetical protein GPJ56_003522 [Histomonas meleagridis]KAH0806408.1 hypothetical protein GO595_000783 [Histomonas meleagridis]
MLWLLSFISYVIYPNQPPVLLVKLPTGVAVNTSQPLDTLISSIPKSVNVVVMTTQTPIRTHEQITTVLGTATDFYVYKNQSIITLLSRSATNYTTNLTITDVQAKVQATPSTDYIFITENYPQLGSIGVTNPFTKPVWNCLILIIFLILIMIWAIIQYQDIQVQTTFSKKIN